jgi:hypothetical protein
LRDGNSLREFGDPAALDNEQSGWAFEAASGGRVHVKVPAGSQIVNVNR